jgi:hypothetical protein
MQFEARLEIVREREVPQIRYILRTAVRIATSQIIRGTGIDGFLMPNISNSYEQHSVQMQELEVG